MYMYMCVYTCTNVGGCKGGNSDTKVRVSEGRMEERGGGIL